MNMLAKIATWFITSKWGLTILAIILIGGGVLLGAHFFAKHYYDQGRADCQADVIAKQAKENQKQALENVQRNTDASVIAKTADAAGAAVVKESDTKTNEAKTEIRYVYRDAPRTKPVAPGSCVHPVDDRVQERINQAVRAANG